MNYKNFKKQENIDITEIDKFNSISDNCWNQINEFKSLHQINPLRLNYILKYANGLFGKKVLDIGCGCGILSESMAREGALVTGIDMATKLIEAAKFHALVYNIEITYLKETAENYAEKYPKVYDIVTCMEMLEHV
ncbi:MAG: bifunctional 2-polyprenyl-6-hydroxyphenol methylase/3-demethylubiquinol 3-O-methyltransferase UbiG, partial [Arsenophonus sp. ET-DL12-MAG3]